VPHSAMNSWPGWTSQSGAASRCGILIASLVSAGLSTCKGSLPVTFLPKRSCASRTARYAPAASLNDSLAAPFVSVEKPLSAITLPGDQLFGLERSLSDQSDWSDGGWYRGPPRGGRCTLAGACNS